MGEALERRAKWLVGKRERRLEIINEPLLELMCHDGRYHNELLLGLTHCDVLLIAVCGRSGNRHSKPALIKQQLNMATNRLTVVVSQSL